MSRNTLSKCSCPAMHGHSRHGHVADARISLTLNHHYRYIREVMFKSEKGDRSAVQNYIIIITDGKSNSPQVRGTMFE